MKKLLNYLCMAMLAIAIPVVFSACGGSDDDDNGGDNGLPICIVCGGNGLCKSCEGSGICPWCHGNNPDNYTEWDEYSQQWVTIITGKCSVCYGTGTCFECSGTCLCSNCGGSGYAANNSNNNWDDDDWGGGDDSGGSSGSSGKECKYCRGHKDCRNYFYSYNDKYYCHGSGKCQWCGGDGWQDGMFGLGPITCSACNRPGYDNIGGDGRCGYCGGSGICSHCGGTGYE